MIDNQLNNALYLLEKLPYCERYNGKIEKCFIKLKNMIVIFHFFSIEIQR